MDIFWRFKSFLYKTYVYNVYEQHYTFILEYFGIIYEKQEFLNFFLKKG